MEYSSVVTGYRVKDLPEDQRPREKALRFGITSLSDAELLALLLGAGTRRLNALDLATMLLKEDGNLFELSRRDRQSLENIKGIGTAKAVKLMAAFETARRINRHRTEDKFRITGPKDVFEYFRHQMAHLRREELKVILLNTRNEIIAVEQISSGLVNSTAAHPREIFNKAVAYLAASIILIHNHPSQDPTPSKADIEITKKVKNAGDIMDIALLDHIIVTFNKYYSMKSEGDI